MRSPPATGLTTRCQISRSGDLPEPHPSCKAALTGGVRHDVSRAQIYHWRAALRDGRPTEAGSGVVGFVPVVEVAPTTAPPAAPALGAGQPVEIGSRGGRSLRLAASLPTAELRRLIRAVEGA